MFDLVFKFYTYIPFENDLNSKRRNESMRTFLPPWIILICIYCPNVTQNVPRLYLFFACTQLMFYKCTKNFILLLTWCRESLQTISLLINMNPKKFKIANNVNSILMMFNTLSLILSNISMKRKQAVSVLFN